LQREPHRILCSCASCAALFREPASSAARLRTIPERVLCDPGASLTDEQWAALGVPVGLAFFVVDSLTRRCTGTCPSPAGPVEIEIDADAWAAASASVRLARAMEPDVEALLVRRRRAEGNEVLVAPLDDCYALAGAVRSHWRGFDGGEEGRRAIDEQFESLLARSTPLPRTPADEGA
jgi:hypothetical protein